LVFLNLFWAGPDPTRPFWLWAGSVQPSERWIVENSPLFTCRTVEVARREGEEENKEGGR